MSYNPVLKMCGIQFHLEKKKEEMEEIQKQNLLLKNGIAFKNVIGTASEVQSKVDVLSTNVKEMQQAFAALSNRVSNHDDKFSELSEILRTINETLNKHDTILSQSNEIPTKQNEITQVLNTSENNLEKQTILLLGGVAGRTEVLDTLLILENNGQSWKELKIKLPYPNGAHGAQFLNNNLYIFGGSNEKEEVLNCTYKLSKSLKWEKVADMNQKRTGIFSTSVILNNQIWVCGGFFEKEGFKSVEMYDPSTNKWKYMKEMNQSPVQTAVVVNGKIFCSGGENFDSVECYDPSSDVWTFVCNMPQPIQLPGAVEMNGNLILMGGTHYDLLVSKKVWALDTTDKKAKWIEKPSMSIPRSISGIAKIDGNVYVCGGITGVILSFELLNSVEIFDGKAWKDGPKMPTPRIAAAAVAIPMEFAKELERFTVASMQTASMKDVSSGWIHV